MPEYYQFAHHPLGKELQKRVSRILCRLVLFRFRTHVMYSAQLAILNDLIALEESLRSSRDQAKSLRHQAAQIALSARAEGRPPSDSERRQMAQLQEEADGYAFAVRLLRYGRWLYRYVADGIAWRAYRFNRQAIRALGTKEPVPFLSGKANIDKEINLFKAIRRQGRDWLPVMHDLTNCLRTGDYSVFQKGALVRVFELKIRRSSRKEDYDTPEPKNDRERRQAKRLGEVQEFMESGELGALHPDLVGGRSLSTSAIEKHNYDAVSKAIAKARTKGFGFEEPERGLLYIAWDRQTHHVDRALQEARELHPHIFETLFTFRAIMPRFEEYHVSLPITAMELSRRDMTDVIFGKIALMCMLNYACVEDFCRERGVALTIHHDSHRSMRITVNSEPYGGDVCEGLWDRILLEALSLQSFVDFIKAILDEYSTNGG
jgi:hypothetical protein